MYAVIRTGGKQYRVAPGDVLEVERMSHDNGSIEFSEILAVSGQPGEMTMPKNAKVLASVVEEGRGEKILVFHFKRKKQYKKLQGHRQQYTRIKISEIQVDGQSYKAGK
jgi:large subunit ribosomal protein L21